MTVPQYYVIATGTVLFYDYLLTLADEVREGCYSNIDNSSLKPLFEDQICMVWTKIVECASRLNRSYTLLIFGSFLAFHCRESCFLVSRPFSFWLRVAE